MGMPIDDNIDFLNEAKKLFEDIANNPSINETVKTYFIIESSESAIEIMRKYQKITSIMRELNGDFYGSYLKDRQALEKIYEVLKDGNNRA